jgi:hypothetical protein
MTYNALDSAKASPVGDTAAAYKLAHEQRSFEITQLVNRNNFFMVFQGVLLAGLVQSQGQAAPLMNFSVCLAGMVMALYQARMAGGAKYWQIRWEVAVKKLELLLLEDLKDEPRVVQLFTSDLGHLTEAERERINKINSTKARLADQLNTRSKFTDELIQEDLRLPHGLRPICHFFSRLAAPFRTTISRRYSVSKIPLYAGTSLLFVWTLLWVHTFTLWGKTPAAWVISLAPWPDAFALAPFVK